MATPELLTKVAQKLQTIKAYQKPLAIVPDDYAIGSPDLFFMGHQDQFVVIKESLAKRIAGGELPGLTQDGVVNPRQFERTMKAAQGKGKGKGEYVSFVPSAKDATFDTVQDGANLAFAGTATVAAGWGAGALGVTSYLNTMHGAADALGSGSVAEQFATQVALPVQMILDPGFSDRIKTVVEVRNQLNTDNDTVNAVVNGILEQAAQIRETMHASINTTAAPFISFLGSTLPWVFNASVVTSGLAAGLYAISHRENIIAEGNEVSRLLRDAPNDRAHVFAGLRNGVVVQHPDAWNEFLTMSGKDHGRHITNLLDGAPDPVNIVPADKILPEDAGHVNKKLTEHHKQ